MSGFIKLHDEIFTSWEWRHNPTMFYFFCRIIRMANWKEGRFEGIVVKRGQFISSLQKLTANTLLPTQVVRTCIARLKSTREITCESTSKFTIYTIVNYSKYQDNIEKSTDVLTDVLTDEQQASNIQLTTIEEVLRNKEVKEVSAPVKKPSSSHGKLSDEEFIASLKLNQAYAGIDINRELAKMDAWLLTRPNRKKTKKFIVSWLNRIETSVVAQNESTPGLWEV